MLLKKQSLRQGGVLVWVVIGFFVLFFGAVGFIILFGEEVPTNDADFLAQYKADSEIADIAEKTKLTDAGKATFYRAKPEFVEGEEFRKNCLVNKGIELALGCARTSLRSSKIYLLTITDSRFQDHKYPAAVHEMMHVAYNKLSSEQRSELKPLLEEELNKRNNDPHLSANMTLLRNAGGDVDDELHSVFAVEYSDLSPKLEDYYSHYFKDRQEIVEIYKESGLASRVIEMEKLLAEVEELNTQLTSLSSQLQADKSAGNINAYNSKVDQFNNMVAEHNSKVVNANEVYAEIEEFYSLFNPNYQPPEEK